MGKNFEGSFKFHSEVPFLPWVYFSIFLTANFLLSYSSLPLNILLWIAVFGLIMPLALGVRDSWRRRIAKPVKMLGPFLHSNHPWRHNFPAWVWALFFMLLLFTRFFGLTSIPSWLLSDEGIFSSLAMEFNRRPTGNLFFSEARIEPMLIWTMGAFFHLVEPSFFAMRLYPTLLSLTSAFLAFWAVRPLLPPLFSMAFAWFFSFSFWSFSLMRFCTPEAIILFAQLLSLGCLGRLLFSPLAGRNKWLMALSASSLLGFYSYVNWVSVWGFISLGLGVAWWRKRPRDGRPFFIFQTVNFVFLLPLILARLEPGGLDHVKQVWGSFFSLRSWMNYLVGLFYDSLQSFPYASNWGGMIDPVTGALILLGILVAVEKLPGLLLGLLGAGLFGGMLPGTLTNHLELHRITPSFPFWMLLAVLGALTLMEGGGKKFLGGVGLWLMAASLNYYNFIGPYCDVRRVPPGSQWRAPEYENAYRVLEAQRKEAPIYVFSEFSLDYDNKTLNVACYPFDALQKPELVGKNPSLTALLVKVDYAPYLLSRFPGTRFKELMAGHGKDSLRMGLFLIPTQSLGEKGFRAWVAADRVCRDVNIGIKEKNPATPWKVYGDMFLVSREAFRLDPFLRTLFWEKIALFRGLDKDFQGALQAYEEALRVGLAVPHLFNDYAICSRLIEPDKDENIYNLRKRLDANVEKQKSQEGQRGQVQK